MSLKDKVAELEIKVVNLGINIRGLLESQAETAQRFKIAEEVENIKAKMGENMSLKDRVIDLEEQLLLMKGRMAYQEKFTANKEGCFPYEDQDICFSKEGEQYNYPKDMTNATPDNWTGFLECVIASPGRLDRVVHAFRIRLKEGFFVHTKGKYLHGKQGDYLVIFKDGVKAVYTEDEFEDMKSGVGSCIFPPVIKFAEVANKLNFSPYVMTDEDASAWLESEEDVTLACSDCANKDGCFPYAVANDKQRPAASCFVAKKEPAIDEKEDCTGCNPACLRDYCKHYNAGNGKCALSKEERQNFWWTKAFSWG